MRQPNNILDEIKFLYSELFPICRSLTGSGNAKSLEILKKISDFKVIKFKSGQKCYDWKVPLVWKIKDAYIKNNNKKIIDFKVNNLHVVNYSHPIKKRISFNSLQKKLHFMKNLPTAVPYRTSYYKKDWGFCISYNDFLKLDRKSEFDVLIDSKFENGFMHAGEFLKKGSSKKEFIFSSYFCHPSMANDNLSGMIAWVLLLKYIKSLKTKFSYRFIIIPETIGSIAYLFNNENKLSNTLGGFVLTCMSGSGCAGYKKTFLENHKLDDICIKVLKNEFRNLKIYPFDVFGSDERQYSSPHFRIPISTITKDKYFEYKYYHTSLDNLNYAKPENLQKTFNSYLKVIENIEKTDSSEFIIKKNKFKENTFKSVFKCEPMLSKRNLYPELGGANFQNKIPKNKSLSKPIMWTLFFADGSTSVDEIIKKSRIPKLDILKAIKILKKNKLIIEQNAK